MANSGYVSTSRRCRSNRQANKLDAKEILPKRAERSESKFLKEKGSGLFFGIVLNQHHSCFEEKMVVPKVSAIKGLIQSADFI